MKTITLKTALAACVIAFSVYACNPSGGSTDQTTNQMGDTSHTGTANTQIDGTDTMTTDTSATHTAPGGAVGKDGVGTNNDTTGTPKR